MKEFVRYAIAVVGYIVLAMFTKHYLTWTYGPIYYIVVLEVLPRTYRRIRSLLTSWSNRPHELAPAENP